MAEDPDLADDTVDIDSSDPLEPDRPRRLVSKTLPRPLTAFRVPAIKIRKRIGATERAVRPFAPIPIEIVDQDERTLARFEAWRAVTNGSLPEFIVWEWLVYKRKLRDGVDFVFQSPLFGGRTRFGGFVIDFYFPQRREGWFVNGERWHLLTPQARARDQLAKEMLAGQGITVIVLWENDLLTRPDFVLERAWFRRESVQQPALMR